MASNKDISSTLEIIADVFKEHVKFQNDTDADVLAVWTAMTYVMDHLEIAPMLYINSPVAQCGKSTVLKLLSAFCHNSRMVSKISPAAIYRLIERDQPTLFFDEADRLLRGNTELNGIINAGHARFEAKVIINQKLPNGNWEPTEFPVWCAKAITGIGGQDDTLVSRSIVISLRRKLITETVKPVRFNLVQSHEATRSELTAWAKEFAPVSEAEMMPYLQANTDRGTDNWLALGIIARRVSSDWERRIQDGLTAIEKRTGSDSQSISIQMLTDVRRAVSEDTKSEWTSADLYNEVVYNDENDWTRFDHGREITKKKFTQLLSEFGITSKKRQKANVFYVSDLEEAFKRYLPPM